MSSSTTSAAFPAEIGLDFSKKGGILNLSIRRLEGLFLQPKLQRA
jgi:hypothetical protein